MIYVYIAGPLFKEAEIRQRRLEAKKINEVLAKKGQEYFIANPIDLPFDNTKVLSSKEIFEEDYAHINRANVFFFELASEDPGTLVELGNVVEKYIRGASISIYPVFFDLRLQRNDAKGVECPVGFNSYVVGCLKANEIPIFQSFDEALAQFTIDININ